MHAAISIMIVEPLSIVRAGLNALLSDEPDLLVIGESAGREDLLSLIRRWRPDVLLLEPSLLGQGSAELFAKASALHPDLKVVILADRGDEARVRELLAAGVAGCFLKSDRPEELLRGIRAAVAGEPAVSGVVLRWLLGQPLGRGAPSLSDSLTEREREVLDLLYAGLSNKEIAQKLYLSVRTVEVHLRNVYGKLGVRSRLEAVTRMPGLGRPDVAERQQ
ncbi:MAG: response regulator transcription factor [Chloroflexi bacterium]|nr:response regulator transcription factor [Chloroflexota bacterium]